MMREIEKNAPYQRRLRLSSREIALASALTAAALISLVAATWGAEKTRPVASIKPAGPR